MIKAGQLENATTHRGVELSIRPVQTTDGDLLSSFFAKVSSDDLRFRFLAVTKEVSAEQIALLVNVDHRQSEGFLAFLEDGSLAATTMVAGDAAGKRAEVAVVVRADLKGQGIGWTMLNHAAAYAKNRGIEVLESVESRQNQSAIEVERDLGFAIEPYPDDPTLVIVSKKLA